MKTPATIALFIGLAVSGNASAQEVVLSGNGTTANNPYLTLVADGCGFRRQGDLADGPDRLQPRVPRLPLLFRPCNPTRNA